MNWEPGGKTGYMEAGTGRCLVLIPGLEGSRHFWRFQLEALSSRYRVVACDLPVRRPSLKSGIADYAAEILLIMDTLGIDKAVVVGESMGGMVAQELAINHAERVEAIVLCNTVDHRSRFRLGINMFTVASLIHNLAFLPFLSVETRRRILRWVGRHRGFVMDPSPGNEALIDYLFEHGTEAGIGGYLDRMIAGGKVRYTEKLSSISVPALVIRGSEDRLVTAEAAVQLAGRIPGAQVALIEGGGHCCPYTRPEETSRAILDWLQRTGL